MTKSAKHTPGPWFVLNPDEVKKKFNVEDKDACYRICADDNPSENWPWTVAEIAGSIDDYGNEEANASLIAAAPELLEQLQYLETAARRYANGDDGQPSYLLKMCDKAKQTISKAEGRA